jgi:hypothetical protein
LRNRQRFVKTLGVAGLGLGLLAGAAGAPATMAQENQWYGIDRPLFQHEEGTLDLSDEELRQLLIQLLQEREREKEGPFQGDEDADVIVVHPRGGGEALRVENYHEFTQALADELNIDDPDEVDAAIRSAMMAVVDDNAGLDKADRERQKALIAAADVPIGPAYRGAGG